MKFRQINNRSKRLNEGKGKFEIERDYEMPGYDWVHTKIEWPDNLSNLRTYDIKMFFSVTLERGNEADALGQEGVYCTIEGYNREAEDFANKVISKIESLGGYTKIVNYLKSL